MGGMGFFCQNEVTQYLVSSLAPWAPCANGSLLLTMDPSLKATMAQTVTIGEHVVNDCRHYYCIFQWRYAFRNRHSTLMLQWCHCRDFHRGRNFHHCRQIRILQGVLTRWQNFAIVDGNGDWVRLWRYYRHCRY